MFSTTIKILLFPRDGKVLQIKEGTRMYKHIHSLSKPTITNK